MRGVILEGELYAANGESERVLVFLELESMLNADAEVLYVRRSYGERASVLTLELDAVEAALAALKAEATRRPPEPLPGQTSLELDEQEAAERAEAEREEPDHEFSS